MSRDPMNNSKNDKSNTCNKIRPDAVDGGHRRMLSGSGLSHQGKITDEQNRQPLAFVNVVVNSGIAGGMSDIDGKYEISCKEPISNIKFSYIGYKSYQTSVAQGSEKLNVALTPISFELTEVTIDAGENPAHRIIDSVMAHRKENNPDNLHSYSYSMYDKMVFTIDSSALGKQRNDNILANNDIREFTNILDRNDLMVMETSSDMFFMAPDKNCKTWPAPRFRMKDPTFVYLVSSMQSISFYDDEVNIVGTRYVNPLSQGSKNTTFSTSNRLRPSETAIRFSPSVSIPTKTAISKD